MIKPQYLYTMVRLKTLKCSHDILFPSFQPVKPNEVANDFLFLKKNEQQVTAGR